MTDGSATKKARKGWMYWLSFALSTYAMSEVFSATRVLATGDDARGMVLLVAWLALLVVSLTMLIYQSYKLYKIDGKLTRTVGLFEWFYGLETRLEKREASR